MIVTRSRHMGQRISIGTPGDSAEKILLQYGQANCLICGDVGASVGTGVVVVGVRVGVGVVDIVGDNVRGGDCCWSFGVVRL